MDICKLCRLVARTQVDQTCVSLAPTTRNTWTNIYELEVTVATFSPVATSRGLGIHSSNQRLMAALLQRFPYFFFF